MEKEYAYAVMRVAEKGMSEKNLLLSLKRVLASRGHVSLMPKIARALKEEVMRTGRGAESVLHVAKESEAHAAKTAAAGYIGTSPVRVVTDDSLIGGWVLTTPDTRVDASFKKQ